jgi:hypothetical protein
MLILVLHGSELLLTAYKSYLDDVEIFLDTCTRLPGDPWYRKCVTGRADFEDKNYEDNNQNDSSICCLFLAAAVVENEPLLIPETWELFRRRLLSDLLGFCDLNLDKTLCHVCHDTNPPETKVTVRTRQGKETKSCEKCGHFTHVYCSISPPHIIRRPGYYFVCQDKNLD